MPARAGEYTSSNYLSPSIRTSMGLQHDSIRRGPGGEPTKIVANVITFEM